MSVRGVGDRWLAGEQVEGVAYGFKAKVEIADGHNAGERGMVVLLMDVRADPLYLVELPEQASPLRVRQSALKPVG